MNITVSQKKQELRKDPLVDFLVDFQKWIKQYSVTLVGIAAALAFVILVYGGYLWIRNRNISNAQEAFGKAVSAYASQDEAKAIELLTIVADNHKNTPHAAYSAYLLGTIFLGQGKNEEAIQWLKEAAARKRGNGFIPGAAAEALSAAYEGTGDLESACRFAEDALKDERLSYRYPALRWKLALINAQLSRPEQAMMYCKQLMSDTLALQYRQKAENFLAELETPGKS